MENFFGITTAVEVTNPVASVDKFYGPYDTMELATYNMNIIGKPGRMFGVKNGTKIQLYIYQGTTTTPTLTMNSEDFTSANIIAKLGYTPLGVGVKATGLTVGSVASTKGILSVSTDNDLRFLESMEYELEDLSITSSLTNAQLDTAYPSAEVGFQLVCPNLEGGTIYKKTGRVQNNNYVWEPIKYGAVNGAVDMKAVDFSTTEPTALQLLAKGVDRVDFPSLNTIYFQCGNKWLKFTGTELL